VKSVPRPSLLKHSIRKNHLPIFREILPKIKLNEEQVLDLIKLSRKNTEFTKELLKFYPLYDKVVEILITYQDMELLNFCIEQNITLPKDITEYAVKSGNLDFLERILMTTDINPSYNDDEAFWTAVDLRCWDTTMMLFSDYRVQPNISVDGIRKIFQN
jgi:hypothetical protein